MKQFILSLMLVMSGALNAQTRYSMYEFMKTATGTYECFAVGSQPAVTNAVSYNYCSGSQPCGIRIVPNDTMSNICANSPIGLNTVDYCFWADLDSTYAYDAFIRTSGWELSPSSSSAISMELKVQGYELKLDSIVVIYRGIEIPTLQLNVGAYFDPTVVSVEQNLVSTASWASAVLDLSSVPCTQASDILGYAVQTLRFVPYGSDNAAAILDIDAIRVYGHDCSISTAIAEVFMESAIVQTPYGVQVTASAPSQVLVSDSAGRVVFYKENWTGMDIIPLEQGLYVVRVGKETKKLMVQ